MKKTYRVHFTCPAGHTTYSDYKTKKAALNNYLLAFYGWWGIWIEIIKPEEK